MKKIEDLSVPEKNNLGEQMLKISDLATSLEIEIRRFAPEESVAWVRSTADAFYQSGTELVGPFRQAQKERKEFERPKPPSPPPLPKERSS